MATIFGSSFDDNSTINNGEFRPRLIGTVDEGDFIYGLAGNDKLEGLGGDDSLNGGIGGDEMKGGKGFDTYYVDDSYDFVIEDADQGFDTIFSIISMALPDNVEKLVLLTNSVGISPVLGVGNNLDNFIYGNERNNTLRGVDGDDYLIGEEGNDSLFGGEGNDDLDGGVGTDTMTGGEGNDFYTIDTFEEFSRDQVIEAADAGTDTIRLQKATVAFTLPDNFENVRVGEFAKGVNGNELRNFMSGSDIDIKSDTLSGLAGDDIINGLAGNDFLIGGADNDNLDGGEGRDTLHGAANAGGTNAAADELDTLTGGSEGDKFILGTANNILYKGSGRALITDFSRFAGELHSDKIQVHGSISNYTLSYSNIAGGSALDTRILHEGNLIGIVQDVTVFQSDFISV